jgi:glycosyltransferase involved in cell wall biosynthesis
VKIYWFWPFSREEYLSLPFHVGAHGAIEDLVVSTIDRPGAWTGDDGSTRILTDLPGVHPARGARWFVDRASVYARRAALRDRAVRRSDPDLVHIWFTTPWIDPFDVRRLRRRRPTVLHVHDVWPHEARLPEAVVARHLRALYTAASSLVVYHHRLRDALATDFDIDPARVSVIPHPIPGVHDAARGTSRGEGTMVLFFGTFRANKGLPVLVQAIRDLGPRPDLRWVIAGSGDQELERLVADLAAERPDVDAHIGWSTAAAKSRLYAQADLVVLPYTSFASQSGVLHDAYGHGVPVVVTDVGALGPTVRADGTGWVVAPRDVAALAREIERAVADRPGREQRAAAAADRAAAGSPERVAGLLVELYASLLGRAPADGVPAGTE